jgi:membrane protein
MKSLRALTKLLVPQRRNHSAVKKLALAAAGVGSALASWTAIPYLLTGLTNLVLRKIPGLRGHVRRVALHPLGGSVIFEGLGLVLEQDHQTPAILEISQVTAKIRWKYLFIGGLVGDITVDHPRSYVDLSAFHQSTADHPASAARPSSNTKNSPSWQQQIRNLFPFQINLNLWHGEFHLAGLPGQGDADVRIHDLDLAVNNVTNNSKLSSALMTQIEGRGQVMSSGRMTLHVLGYPLAEKPTFNADFKLEGLRMRELTAFAQEFAAVRVQEGTLSAFIEAAAKDGQLQGYAKPVIDHLELERVSHQGVGSFAKAAAVEAGVKLLQSRQEDRIATRVDFQGDFADPEFDFLGTMGLTLKNAFIRALGGNFENKMWIERAGIGAADTRLHVEHPTHSKFRQGYELVKDSFSRWSSDQAIKMSAALAYYTAFSIAPLLLIVISIAGLVFGKEAAQGQIANQLTGLVGSQSAETIQSMLRAANHPAKGAIATVIGVVSLLLGATGVLNELKDGLNKIWRTESPGGLKALVKQNLKAFGIIASVGFLLLVSLAVSAALAAAGKFIGGALPIPEAVMHILEFFVSWAIISALFGVIFKVLPNVVIPWKDVVIGSVVTGLLFSLGKLGLGAYLGKGTVGSSYGAAGSVLIVLLWVYYSGLILYFGAEFTRVYSEKYGSRAQKPESQPEFKKAA